MSDYFRDARHIRIGDGAIFSHVGRDQHNYHTTQIIRKAKRRRTEFDDVHQVKSSAILRLRDIHVDTYENRCKESERYGWIDPGRNFDRTICVAQVDREGRMGTVCTTVSYTGPDAQEAFLEEYRERLKLAMTTMGAQVYAIDIGSVPSMIYWNELVPAAVFIGNSAILGHFYLYNLCYGWECDENELWMDASRGVICRGPKGPEPNLLWLNLGVQNLPSTVDLLQEDVFLRFLASCKSKKVDREFLKAIWWSYVTEDESEIAFDRPTVFSTLTQTPIAVANNSWEDLEGNLSEPTLLENGLTRFCLDGDATYVYLKWNSDAEQCWLSQALSVFHTLGIEENLDDFKFVYRRASLHGYLSEDKADRRPEQPIFLFVRSPPPNLPRSDTCSLHYWSFEENSQNPLSPDTCHEFGLPNELKFHDYGYQSYSWPINTYKQLREYQLLRDFDPTTTEFARHVGYNGDIFQTLHAVTRFEEVTKEQTSRYPRSIDTDIPVRVGLGGGISNTLPTQIRRDHECHSSDSPSTTGDFGNKRRESGVSTEMRSDAREPVDFDFSLCSQDIPRISSTMNYSTGQQTSIRPVRPLPRRCTPNHSLNGMATDPFQYTTTFPQPGGFPPNQLTYSVHSILSTFSSTYFPANSFHIGMPTCLFPVHIHSSLPPSTHGPGSYTYPSSYSAESMWNESSDSSWPPQPIPSASYHTGSVYMASMAQSFDSFESTVYRGTVATSNQAGGRAGSTMSYPDSQPGVWLETQPFYNLPTGTNLYGPSTGDVQSEENTNNQAGGEWRSILT